MKTMIRKKVKTMAKTMKKHKSYDINYKDHPLKDFDTLLSVYGTKKILIIDDVLHDKESYRSTYQDLLDICKYGYEKKEIREMKIKFKFHREDLKSHSLQLRHLLSNLVLWYGFMEADTSDIMDETYIHEFYKIQYWKNHGLYQYVRASGYFGCRTFIRKIKSLMKSFKI